MLNNQTIATIKSTIPLIAQTGPALTAHFYERMFSHHPELKDIFNMSHQTNGDQREALFNAICAYAVNIENLEAILPAVEKIAQKHASLTIKPQHYAIVGEHLLATIDELFSPGEEVLRAWGEAYQLLADIFIAREEQIYHEKEVISGGWRGLREFRVVKKQAQSQLITSFELAPTDNLAVADFKSGQYISLYINDDSLENQEIRQYSLTLAPNKSHYRIAIKREQNGNVSQFMHDKINEGDCIQLTPPHGDFFLDVATNTPVVLISAGVGLTPMMSMLHSLNNNQHQGEVLWFHAAENGTVHAFKDEVNQLGQELNAFDHATWYQHPNANDLIDHKTVYKGLIALDHYADRLKAIDRQYYFCGPVGFMQTVAQQLMALGIPADSLHYECFGPHKVL